MQTLSRPRLCLTTMCARTRQATCFEIICWERLKGWVRAWMVAGPSVSRCTMARRVGSDKAAKVMPSLSTTKR